MQSDAIRRNQLHADANKHNQMPADARRRAIRLMKHAIKRGAAYRCARQLAAAPTRLGTAPPAQRAISLMREAISLMREAIILMREAIGWGRLHLHPRVE